MVFVPSLSTSTWNHGLSWCAIVFYVAISAVSTRPIGDTEACGGGDHLFLGIFEPDKLSYQHVYFHASTAPVGTAVIRFETTRIGQSTARLLILGSYAYPNGRFASATLTASFFEDAGCRAGARIGQAQEKILQNSSATALEIDADPAIFSRCDATYSGDIRIDVDRGKQWVALSPNASSTCFAFQLCCSDSCDAQSNGLCTTDTHCKELGHQIAKDAACPDSSLACCIGQHDSPQPSPAAPPDISSLLAAYAVFAIICLVIIGVGLYYIERRKQRGDAADEFSMHEL